MSIAENTGLTDKEFYRLHGALTPARIERLVEQADSNETLLDFDVKVKEAMGTFPAEDFLAKPLKKLGELAARLRGMNKDTAQAIIGMLEEIAQSTVNDADYGRSELREVLHEFEKAKRV